MRVTLLAVLLLFTLAVSPARAATQLALALPPDRLDLQLRRLSSSFATPIIFEHDAALTQAVSVPSGDYSLEAALQTVLQGSGFTFLIQPAGVLIVPATQENASTTRPQESHLDSHTLDETIVYGFRRSLISARKLKRSALGIEDSVLAADIAQYPDLNLAESLQRLPGVTITREAGEGRQISLRGLPPRFTLVQLNGMNVLGNSDSPMDSRGQKTRNRAFDFNIFASELFQQLTIEKSYRAVHQEGGLAGTVRLSTPKPFDTPGLHFNAVLQGGQNQYMDAPATRAAVLAANTWGQWGALFSIAHSQRHSGEWGANTVRWRQASDHDADLSALAPSIQSAWQGAELYQPRGNRYSVWQNEQSRLGITAAIQFQNDAHEMTLDGLYSELDLERNEFHLYPRGASLTPIIPGQTRVLEAEANAANELIYARYADAQMATESRRQDALTEFTHIKFDWHWQLSEASSLRTTLGHSHANFSMPFSAKIFAEGVSEVTVDYRADRFFGDYRYGSDTRSAGEWSLHEVDKEEFYSRSEYDVGRIELIHAWQPGWQWQGGLDLTTLHNASALGFAPDLLRDEWQANPLPVSEAYSHILTAHPSASWRVLDVASTLREFELDTYRRYEGFENTADFGLDSSRDGITERTAAAYLGVQWEHGAWRSEAALRYFHTRTTTHVPLESSAYSLVRRYDGTLPSLTFNYSLAENTYVKTAFSQNLTRPDLQALSREVEIIEADDSALPTVEGPNPDLNPYQSRNVDLSLIHFLDNSGYLEATVFYKALDDFIVLQGETLAFDALRLPASLLPDELDRHSDIYYVSPQNAESASLRGMELVAQSDFSLLPRPFNQAGMMLNLTLADGSLRYHDDQGRPLFVKSLPSMSPLSSNLTLYYDSAHWGFRISSSYRSEYLSVVDTNVLHDEDERGFHETLYWDASAYWYLNDQLKLTFEGINLSDEREEQYSSAADRPYNSTYSGTTWYAGISFSL